ncbi:MAG: 2'-5' RNA ligase family protein [Flavobacteriales bacterium]|nr:2'-5' RNA ligase family protein [Flavobacteriales bacterium]
MLLHRFLLTILPSPALSGEVDRLKALVHERVGSFSGRNTIPHITLFFADLPLECERDVCEGIARSVVGHKGFVLRYNGITHFPDKQTIYIDPVEKDAIAAMRLPIIAALKATDTLREAIRDTDHPHLTIAAGLKPAQFERAWESLAPHVLHPAVSGELRAEEQVTEVVLLRRAMREGERYASTCAPSRWSEFPQADRTVVADFNEFGVRALFMIPRPSSTALAFPPV